MRVYKKISLLLFLLTGLVGMTALATLNRQGQSGSNTKQKEETEKSHWPIADYVAPEPDDPEKQAKRRARGKKYESKLTPVSPSSDVAGAFLVTHWDRGLSPIPVTESDVIIRGEVTDAQAYLSPEKTGVYSEFDVRITEVLKNKQVLTTLSPGSQVPITRAGGRLKVPSGRVQTYAIAGQDMPHIGRQYLLFLKCSGQDFELLTGFELRAGSVHPLDDVQLFKDFRGKSEAGFLEDVRAAINNSLK
jgi:hypothetical protein